MNFIDIGVLVIIILCAIGGFKRGLIYSVYKLLSFLIALFLAGMLYPHIARLIRDTVVFSWMKEAIKQAMDLEGHLNEAMARGYGLIDVLPLPGIIREILHVNNNQRMFELLRVTTIQDYVAGFFANLIIVALSIVIVFASVMLILSIVGVAIDVVGRLPVIRTINQIGGAGVGILFGAALSALTLFLFNLLLATNPFVIEQMSGSRFAYWVFYTFVQDFLGINL